MRSFHHADFPLDRVLEAKGGATVSVCLPARDEARTIGAIVAAVPDALVDEIVVVDDGSTDDTAGAARQAGARVVSTGATGKGAAMARGLAETSGDIVVYLDADVRNFGAHFVTALAGPLLACPDVAFVKAFYERPHDGAPGQGGRVTQLVARPLLALLFPELEGVRQPLAGETAGRREVLEKARFEDGYGVEVGLLVDVAEAVGVDAIAQVDLGVRVHRNRPLAELAPQSEAVIKTALERAGLLPRPRPR